MDIRFFFDSLTNHFLEFAAGYWSTAHPEISARHWSNCELKKLGSLFFGSVVNVSAGLDDDKQGGKYHEYFPNAQSYTITNYRRLHTPNTEVKESILDLSIQNSAPLNEFDLVFSHTVLEHIYEFDIALNNLCRMSQDLILTVVPFMQSMHIAPGIFGDYWRFTQFALHEAFLKHGYHTLYCNFNNDHPLSFIYIVHLASKYPEKHREKFPPLSFPTRSDSGPGNLLNHLISYTNISKKKRIRLAGMRLGQVLAKSHSKR